MGVHHSQAHLDGPVALVPAGKYPSGRDATDTATACFMGVQGRLGQSGAPATRADWTEPMAVGMPEFAGDSRGAFAARVRGTRGPLGTRILRAGCRLEPGIVEGDR